MQATLAQRMACDGWSSTPLFFDTHDLATLVEFDSHTRHSTTRSTCTTNYASSHASRLELFFRDLARDEQDGAHHDECDIDTLVWGDNDDGPSLDALDALPLRSAGARRAFETPDFDNLAPDDWPSAILLPL